MTRIVFLIASAVCAILCRAQAESTANAYVETIEDLNRNVWLLISIIVLICVSVALAQLSAVRRRRLQRMRERMAVTERLHEESKRELQAREEKLQDVSDALQKTHADLTNCAMYLRTRNELLDNIRKMVREAYKLDAALTQVHLRKINAYITQCLANDRTASELLLSVEEKHNEFLSKLMARHPNLTRGEKYLATLLRVNLSTKEIALLTGTLTKTVNMGRYRLRKSLGLDADTDLIPYLQSI